MLRFIFTGSPALSTCLVLLDIGDLHSLEQQLLVLSQTTSFYFFIYTKSLLTNKQRNSHKHTEAHRDTGVVPMCIFGVPCVIESSA